jgi:hypothetical protein
MKFGLMGVGSDGTMFTPEGKKLFKLPTKLAFAVQSIQHWVAKKTWG